MATPEAARIDERHAHENTVVRDHGRHVTAEDAPEVAFAFAFGYIRAVMHAIAA